MDSAGIKQIEKQEHDKYTRLYKENYGATGYQRKISEFIRWTTKKGDKILDLGCGMGIAVKFLLRAYCDAMGVDITLNGIEGNKERFVEAPLWDMQFADGEFDCTFSTDVMEHITPELVEKAIKEIFRVTQSYTLHVVCTRPSEYESGLHLTVKPIEWWREQFHKHNKKNISCVVMGYNEMLTLYNMKRLEVITSTDPGVINGEEREKYTQLYEGKYAPTSYVAALAEFIKNTANKKDKLLDLGTGHGIAVAHLRKDGYDCKGVDITLAGLPNTDARIFTEAPLWDMPFKDNQFDYTFSTDVFEHIPPKMAKATIKEIYRITRRETFHCISVVDDHNYLGVHLTIKPIQWWKEQFDGLNREHIDTHIVDSDAFVTLCHYVNKRGLHEVH